MLRILINFYGSAHLRELRFNKDTSGKITVEKLKTYLPNQKCELLLMKINNVNQNIIMQDMKTIEYYIQNSPEKINAEPDSSTATLNEDFIFNILEYSSSEKNGFHKLQDMISTKSIDSFVERLKVRSNPNLMRESLRLKDMRMMKLSRRDEEIYYKYLQVEKPSKISPTILSDMNIFKTIPEDPLPFIF